ncbi:unnamed protein product [Rotaria sp. Silwood1]|nr:unnamed protein product [Rotaria sp. Silwood1]CAF1428054.1 unnamed protein product [Rotaria sp. Silwood1]CAF4765055.1 unnamed protein product [Rotaria sp. Silwood1]
MFTQYRHHIALYKTSLAQSDYLCVNLLPKIGCEVRSLLIDCCFSVLQHDLFIKYFGKKMPTIFPNLERIGLVSYQYNQLMVFLDSLHDLNHLTEIRLYGLFSIRSVDQPTAVRSLFRANNNQLTTILIDDQSRSLHFRSIDCYLNILRLRINLKTTADLPYLFHAVPNVQYLDVIIDEHGSSWTYFDELKLSPLLHLTHFQLTSTKQLWMLEELLELFVQLPIVQHLSLFLFTDDRRLIEGDTILSSLSSTVQQFDYAINFSHKMSSDLVEERSQMLQIPKLSWLLQVFLYGSIPSGLNHFAVILNAAPNLFRLGLSFECLWHLIGNPQICLLLGQRITSLAIYNNATDPSSVTLNEEHIPIIASTFFRVCYLYANLTHLPKSTTILSNDDIFENFTTQNLSAQSCEQEYQVISPCSSESMVVCLLAQFKEHRLVGVGIDGEFSEYLQKKAKQWLQDNTVLCGQEFEAVFNDELDRLLIWM